MMLLVEECLRAFQTMQTVPDGTPLLPQFTPAR